MPITINGSGTVTGISAGGLPDGSITAPDLDGAQTGAAPIYGCRAWVNFNGTRNATDTGASTNGANVLIRASGNVASVLKNGTGDFTVTFTTAMPDVNYAVQIMGGRSTDDANVAVGGFISSAAAPTTSSVRIKTNNPAIGYIDSDYTAVAIFR